MNLDPSYRNAVNDPAFAVMNDTDDSDLPLEQRRYPPGVKNTKSTHLGIPPFDILTPAKPSKTRARR